MSTCVLFENEFEESEHVECWGGVTKMGGNSLEDGKHDLLDVDVDAGRQGEGDVFKGFEGCFEQRESI